MEHFDYCPKCGEKTLAGDRRRIACSACGFVFYFNTAAAVAGIIQKDDTILLVTINPADNSINITSFPRDLYVNIPGGKTNRINTAFGRGGFETLASTFEYNLGVRPDYYALINFWSFTNLIDNLGGIDVNASQPLSEHTAHQ